MKGHDIYLPNGRVLENDNVFSESDEPIEIVLRRNESNSTNIPDDLRESIAGKIDINRKATIQSGSVYDIFAGYQIFYNPEEEKAVIVYSPEVFKFKDSFYWNVFWVYIPYNEGYSPLYFIILEKPDLYYLDGEWQIESEQYTGSVKYYIDKVVGEIEGK